MRNIKMNYEEKFKRFKKIINELKNVPCKDCGGTFPPEAMDFDHRRPSEKRFSVGTGYSYSIKSLMAEIAKCDIVCSNCHRTRSFGQTSQKLKLDCEIKDIKLTLGVLKNV